MRSDNVVFSQSSVDPGMSKERFMARFRAEAGRALPSPVSIAVAGASDIGSGNYYGARVLANLVDAGTSATIYPINPRLSGSTLLDL